MALFKVIILSVETANLALMPSSVLTVNAAEQLPRLMEVGKELNVKSVAICETVSCFVSEITPVELADSGMLRLAGSIALKYKLAEVKLARPLRVTALIAAPVQLLVE